MFLSKFDILSPEITLFYRGKERHSSIFSGIMSIGFVLTISFFIYYLSYDFLLKKNPEAYFYTRYIEEVGLYYFNTNGLFHFIFFNLQDDYSFDINENYFSIIGVSAHDSQFISNNNESLYNHYIYGKCEKSDAGDRFKYFSDDMKIYFSHAFCIKKYYDSQTSNIIYNHEKNFTFPKLQHGAASLNNIKYGIYIQFCQNNSKINKTNCYSDDNYIKKKFEEGLGYSIAFIDQFVDVKDYKNPFKFIFQRISNAFNINSYTANHLNFHPIDLITNEGIFIDRKKEVFSFTYEKNEKLTMTNAKNIYGSFNFWMQNQIDSYSRTYKKIWDIAGGLDGIIDFLMLIIRFINLIIFNDFQTINDFNDEIGINIKKNSKITANESSLRLNSKNNSNKNLIPKKPPLNYININRLSPRKSKSSKISNFQTSMEKSYKKINRYELLFNVKLKCNKNKYIFYLINQREKIISEEMMIKNYLTIKKLKQFFYFKENQSLNELDSYVLNLDNFQLSSNQSRFNSGQIKKFSFPQNKIQFKNKKNSLK